MIRVTILPHPQNTTPLISRVSYFREFYSFFLCRPALNFIRLIMFKSLIGCGMFNFQLESHLCIQNVLSINVFHITTNSKGSSHN